MCKPLFCSSENGVFRQTLFHNQQSSSTADSPISPSNLRGSQLQSGVALMGHSVMASRCFALAFIITLTLSIPLSHAESNELKPYHLRGKQIEQLYQIHTENLQTAFEILQAIVKNERPDLLTKLQKTERRRYGYQLIPKILPVRPKPLKPLSQFVLCAVPEFRFPWAGFSF